MVFSFFPLCFNYLLFSLSFSYLDFIRLLHNAYLWLPSLESQPSPWHRPQLGRLYRATAQSPSHGAVLSPSILFWVCCKGSWVWVLLSWLLSTLKLFPIVYNAWTCYTLLRHFSCFSGTTVGLSVYRQLFPLLWSQEMVVIATGVSVRDLLVTVVVHKNADHLISCDSGNSSHSLSLSLSLSLHSSCNISLYSCSMICWVYRARLILGQCRSM